MIHITFEENDYEITDFESGEQILSGEVGIPDLFILDKSLSGTNGLDVCRFIKNDQRFKNIPVIMLSASLDIVTLAKEAGADHAIAKPFSLKNMREIVCGILE